MSNLLTISIYNPVAGCRIGYSMYNPLTISIHKSQPHSTSSSTNYPHYLWLMSYYHFNFEPLNANPSSHLAINIFNNITKYTRYPYIILIIVCHSIIFNSIVDLYNFYKNRCKNMYIQHMYTCNGIISKILQQQSMG